MLTNTGAILAASCVFAVSGQAGASRLADAKALFATVDNYGHVTLKNAAGMNISRLRAGRITVTVHDKSTRQDFHLVGADPSINPRTGVAFVGAVTWRLSLVPGVYRYYSDRNRSASRTFRVIR